MQENLDISDFALEEADKDAIFQLAQEGSCVVDPPGLAPVCDPTPPLPAFA